MLSTQPRCFSFLMHVESCLHIVEWSTLTLKQKKKALKINWQKGTIKNEYRLKFSLWNNIYPTFMNILVLQSRLNKPKCICCYFHERDRSFHFFVFCLILLSDDFCCHFRTDYIHHSCLCFFRNYLLGISGFRICMPFWRISCSIVCYKYAL